MLKSSLLKEFAEFIFPELTFVASFVNHVKVNTKRRFNNVMGQDNYSVIFKQEHHI